MASPESGRYTLYVNSGGEQIIRREDGAIWNGEKWTYSTGELNPRLINEIADFITLSTGNETKTKGYHFAQMYGIIEIVLTFQMRTLK